MTKTTTLWIDNNLVIRHSEKGWPVEPNIKEAYTAAEATGMQIEWHKALAQAKAESILAGCIHVQDPKPDSFIEFNGSIDVVCQALQGDVWADIIPKYYEKMKNNQPDRFRKYARLKPASSAMIFSEGAEFTGEEIGSIRWDKEKGDLEIVADQTPNLRARILEEFNTHWMAGEVNSGKARKALSDTLDRLNIK